MKRRNLFFSVVLPDVVAISALALWVIWGNAAAESLFKAIFWVLMPFAIVSYTFSDPRRWARIVSSPLLAVYARVVKIVSIALLAMAHETVMIAVLIIAWIAFESAVARSAAREGNNNVSEGGKTKLES